MFNINTPTPNNSLISLPPLYQYIGGGGIHREFSMYVCITHQIVLLNIHCMQEIHVFPHFKIKDLFKIMKSNALLCWILHSSKMMLPIKPPQTALGDYRGAASGACRQSGASVRGLSSFCIKIFM